MTEREKEGRKLGLGIKVIIQIYPLENFWWLLGTFIPISWLAMLVSAASAQNHNREVKEGIFRLHKGDNNMFL